MSATIHYRREDKKDPYLYNVGGPSAFINTLERAFGQFPCTLGATDLPKLEGMAAMAYAALENNPYTELVEVIRNNGTVYL